jgi:hypothetical protein
MITYRETKGAPLSVQEMDNNFRTLDDRLQRLETGTFEAETLTDIQVQDGALTLTGSRGQTFGPFPLPRFNPRGAWSSTAQYTTDDLVYTKSGLFRATEPLAPTETFTEEHWEILCRFPTQAPQALPAYSSRLPLKSPEDLDDEAQVGDLGLLIRDGTGPQPIFYDGTRWCALQTTPLDF